MSGIREEGSSTPRGLLGVLRAWLEAQTTDIQHPTTVLPNADEDSELPPCGNVRVLVADDNPVNLMVVSALLKSRGLAPLLAADGAEAVALACGLEFDLILMDLQMPILDGLGATSAIRRFESESARAAVPVIAYSGMSPGAGVLAAHGMSGSLNKPCEDHELEACLVQWCPGYRPAQPLRGAARENNSGWPPANGEPGTRQASLR